MPERPSALRQEDQSMPEEALVDFAVVAFREDDRWQVAALPPRTAEELHGLIATLRQQPTESLALGMCSYGDDFFLALRLHGDEVRLLLSDVTAAGEWPIAQQAVDLLDEPLPDDDDAEQVRPVGDLGIFADLGVSAMEVSAVCSDLELYPDEMLAQIAARIGFGQQFDQAVDSDLV
jgi:putative tRNA adenosine deaminase-associated protein